MMEHTARIVEHLPHLDASANELGADVPGTVSHSH